jgi:hypothetical protein
MKPTQKPIMETYRAMFESFDSAYSYNTDWNMVDDNTPSKFQKVVFETEKGVKYLWMAEQTKETSWTISFGIISKGQFKKLSNNPHDNRKILKYSSSMETKVTRSGDAIKVFSTVLSITQAFTTEFAPYVNMITFSSLVSEASRYKLYLKMAKRVKSEFEYLSSEPVKGDKDEVTHMVFYMGRKDPEKRDDKSQDEEEPRQDD